MDGDQLALETNSSNAVQAKYVRGINGLYREDSSGTRQYYLYNGHGDVVQLGNSSGAVTKTYVYDVFGNEKNIDSNDTNPMRYCGEYLDLSSGTYYLRARYYDPTIGRFLSEDTTRARLMNIYNPNGYYQGIQLNGGVYVDWTKQQYIVNDPLSLNLYTYCSNNPVNYQDSTGNFGTPISWAMAAIAGVAGGFYGNYLADQYGLSGWKRAALIAGVAVGGAAVGFVAGELLVGFTTSFLVSNPAIMMSLSPTVLSLFGINGNNLAVLGRYAEGVGYTNLAQHIGASFFQVPTSVWNSMTSAQQWAKNVEFLDDMISQGKDFVLSSNAYQTLANASGSDFAKEINYLLDHGYKIVENGWKIIAG